MRKFFTRKRTASAAALVVGLALALPAGAGTLFKWVEDDGTVAFTDDPKRIPERYKSAAKKRTIRGLDDYARYSRVDSAAADRQTDQLMARLERLQELNAELWGWGPQAAAAAYGAAPGHNCGAGAPGQALIQVGSRTALAVPYGGEGAVDGPTIVEQVRVQPENRVTTRTDTVIRQGDQIQLIVRPDQQWEIDPGETIPEADLR